MARGERDKQTKATTAKKDEKTIQQIKDTKKYLPSTIDISDDDNGGDDAA